MTNADNKSQKTSSGGNAGFVRRVLIIFGLAALVFFPLYLAVSAFHLVLLFFAGVLTAVLIRALSSPLEGLTRLPQPLSVILVVVLLGGGLALVGTQLAPHVAAQAGQLSNSLPAAMDRIQQEMEQSAVGSLVIDRLPDLGSLLNGKELLRQARSLFSITFAFFSDLFIFFFIAVYLTFEPGIYLRGFLRLVPAARRARAAEVLEAMETAIRRWLLGTLVSMTVTGTLVGVGLGVLGVPLALTLGLLAGLLTFIPYLGAILSALPALLLGFLQKPALALSVAALFLAAHAVEAYVVTPLVQQHQVKLPPVITVIAQILLGMAGGILGLMLATPLVAIGAVIIKMLYIEDVLGERGESSAA